MKPSSSLQTFFSPFRYPMLAILALLTTLAAPVTADVTYTPVDLTPIANASLNDILSPANEKIPAGTDIFGGVPFFIPAGPKNYWNAESATGPNPRTADLNVGIAGVREVYALLDTLWGLNGPESYASVEFFGSNGGYYRKDLIGGEDIREYKTNFTRVNMTTSVPIMTYWTGPPHLDRVRIVLPKEFENQTLTKVRFVDNGGHDQQRLFCAGLTVVTGTPDAAPALEYLPLDLSAFANDRLQKYDESFPVGDLMLGGVPFVIPNTDKNIWTADSVTTGLRSVDIPVGVVGVTEAYTLLDMNEGQFGPGYVNVEFFGSDGAYYKKELSGGEDLRDIGTFRFTTNVNGTTAVPVVDTSIGKHLDRQQLVLPAEFAKQTLTHIKVNDLGARLMLSGVTVARPAGGAGVVTGATPTRVSNHQPTTLTLFGTGLTVDTAVRGTKPGQPDLLPTGKAVDPTGTRMFVTFDVTGKTPGLWQLQVKTPTGASQTLSTGLTLIAGGRSKITVDLLGHSNIRGGRPQRILLQFGNRGIADALGVMLVLTLPKGSTCQPLFSLATPPTVEKQVPLDYSLVPFQFEVEDQVYVPLYLPNIRAGSVGTLPFLVTVPETAAVGHTYVDLGVKVSQPFFSPSAGVGPLPLQASSSTSATANCVNGLLDVALGALGANPGLSLAANGALTMMGAINGGFNSALAQASGQSPTYSGTQVLMAAAGTVAGIAGLAYPPAAIAGAALSAMQGLMALPGAIKACNEAFPDWWKKPFGFLTSRDPNDKSGPTGTGEQRYINGTDPLSYLIQFENKPEATGAAQEVVITDPLDPLMMDLDTVELGPVSFGSRTVMPPPGLSEWTTDVDLRPGQNLVLRIEAKLDRTANALTWRFTSLDPATMKLTEDPKAGFLPPNTTAPEGEGSVLFAVHPKPGLPTGTTITNRASIVFDVNAPIDTPAWTNTIDNLRPTSRVESLPSAALTNRFLVKWGGTDTGSGVKSYTISVSEDGKAYAPWLTDTALTSAVFGGSTGKTYAFRSVATDNAANEEPEHLTADATVKAGSIVVGDVDRNGKVDVRDAILVLQRAAGLATFDASQTAAADVKTDGAINVLDAISLLRQIAGLQ